MKTQDQDTKELADQLDREADEFIGQLNARQSAGLTARLRNAIQKSSVWEDPDIVYRRILVIPDKAAEEPTVDKRPPEEIIGYDDAGLPA